MRVVVCALTLLAAACNATPKTDISDPKIADLLDSRVVMPFDTGPLETYHRRYARTETGWVGMFQASHEQISRAEIVELTELEKMNAAVADGGCMVVHVRFDEQMNFLGAGCNGEA